MRTLLYLVQVEAQLFLQLYLMHYNVFLFGVGICAFIDLKWYRLSIYSNITRTELRIN